MAFNKNPFEFPGASTPVSGSQGKNFKQDPDTDKLTHTRVERGEGDIPIPDQGTTWDLVDDGDFVIPDDTGVLSTPPNIGGANWSVLGVESLDSNAFDLKFEYGYVDSNGTFQTVFTYDKNDNAKFGGGDSYVIAIRPIRDLVKVTITDASGAGQNRIQGGLNSN